MSERKPGRTCGIRCLIRPHVVIAVLAGLACLTVVELRCLFDSSIPFLTKRPPAEWIVCPRTYDPLGRRRIPWRVRFGTTFVLPESARTGRVCLRAFREAVLWVNQTRVNSPGGGDGNWKHVQKHDIGPMLRAGRNRIEVEVNNANGPPALWLFLQADHLSLKTDDQWQTQTEGGDWLGARLATAPGEFPSQVDSPSVAKAWGRVWPAVLGWVVLATVLTLLGSRWVRRGRANDPGENPLELQPAGRYEYVLLAATVLVWVVLCANNLVWLLPSDGFDVNGHLDYVNVVRTQRRLPMPNEGWEAYQPPLYYVVSACLVAIGRCVALANADNLLPRLVSMISGLAQTVLVWSVARTMFPADRRARCVALVLAAAMPMNLYMSQHPSNEMMCTALVTAGLLLALRILRDNDTCWKRHAVLGAVLGAALLCKYTAFLAVAAVVTAVGGSVLMRAGDKKQLLLRTAGVASTAVLAVAGWFYFRNWVVFGKPFIGNWDPAANTSWWIDPGYGTSAYYLRFGRVFTHPFDAWLYSYADSIYSTVWGDSMCSGSPGLFDRPPWHYNLMSVGYTLALCPTVLISIGLLAAIVRWVKAPSGSWALLVGHGTMVAFAVFYLTLVLPYYPQAKGFYGLTSMACLCVLGAWGFGWLSTILGRVGVLLWVPLLVWGINSYASFLVSPVDAEAQARVGIFYLNQKEDALARSHFNRAVKLDSGSGAVSLRLSEVLCTQGRYTEALGLLRGVLARDPNDMEAMGSLAILLASCQDDTVRDGRAAAELSGRLCKITRYQNVGALDLLAAAQAELGRFDEAVRTLDRAIHLAESSGKAENLPEMRSRLELYKAGKPYRHRYAD